jgi:hypothetical protein
MYRIIYIFPVYTEKQVSLFKQYRLTWETVLTGILFFAIAIGIIGFSWGLTPEVVSQ